MCHDFQVFISACPTLSAASYFSVGRGSVASLTSAIPKHWLHANFCISKMRKHLCWCSLSRFRFSVPDNWKQIRAASLFLPLIFYHYMPYECGCILWSEKQSWLWGGSSNLRYRHLYSSVISLEKASDSQLNLIHPPTFFKAPWTYFIFFISLLWKSKRKTRSIALMQVWML